MDPVRPSGMARVWKRLARRYGAELRKRAAVHADTTSVVRKLAKAASAALAAHDYVGVQRCLDDLASTGRAPDALDERVVGTRARPDGVWVHVGMRNPWAIQVLAESLVGPFAARPDLNNYGVVVTAAPSGDGPPLRMEVLVRRIDRRGTIAQLAQARANLRRIRLGLALWRAAAMADPWAADALEMAMAWDVCNGLVPLDQLLGWRAATSEWGAATDGIRAAIDDLVVPPAIRPEPALDGTGTYFRGADSTFVCRDCGDEMHMPTGVPVDMWTATAEAFSRVHARCATAQPTDDADDA